ncbi:MAG: hypothetical protein HY892_22775 [Deltaproteobacteria bacterium]|nr:hypothetical protein [Deltaproteobacteria bacterium]
MACINPDGTVTESAKDMLRALSEPRSPEKVAAIVAQPLFKVRSSLRELAGGGLALEVEGKFTVTAKGREKIQG